MEALWSGKCPACGERIEFGDEIVYSPDADAFVHANCKEEDD